MMILIDSREDEQVAGSTIRSTRTTGSRVRLVWRHAGATVAADAFPALEFDIVTLLILDADM
ncbi:hypothetical protein CRG98_047685 [Punica granatum]|uniref:Uncharacterized protein n=1 Tax=Punica granatum TaxID=22663 RepID=A0A2I0HJN7_PUNGR|nr:hypothetical protein CRG98_047685 [Punica granatum]